MHTTIVLLVCSLFIFSSAAQSIDCYDVSSNFRSGGASSASSFFKFLTTNLSPLVTFNVSFMLQNGTGPVPAVADFSVYTWDGTLSNATGTLLYQQNYSTSLQQVQETITSPTYIFTPCQSVGPIGLDAIESDGTQPSDNQTFIQVTSYVRVYNTRVFNSCTSVKTFVNFSPYYLTIDFTNQNVTNKVYLNFTDGNGQTSNVPFTSYCIAKNSCDASGPCVQQGQLSTSSGYDITANLEPGLYYVILQVTNSGGDYVLAANYNALPHSTTTSSATSQLQFFASSLLLSLLLLLVVGLF